MGNECYIELLWMLFRIYVEEDKIIVRVYKLMLGVYTFLWRNINLMWVYISNGKVE